MNALEAFLELIRTYPGAFAYLAGILTLCALAFVAGVIGIRWYLDHQRDAGFPRDYRSRHAEWEGNRVRNTLRQLHRERV